MSLQSVITPSTVCVMTPDPHPNDRYRCLDDGALVVGDDGIRRHGAVHRECGDGPPEWEVVEDETE